MTDHRGFTHASNSVAKHHKLPARRRDALEIFFRVDGFARGKRSSRISGSAMIECVVLMVVMVPVLAGVAMLGKLIDLRQTTEQAGRYAAWEATVYAQDSPGGAQPQALRERFFGRASQALRSSASTPEHNTLWGEKENAVRAGLLHASRLEIDESSAQGTPYDRDISTPTIAMSIGQQAGRSGEILDGLSGNTWGLSSDGMLRAGVGVNVKSNSWLVPANANEGCGSATVFACIESSSVILVDGWSASSDDQARRRVRSLMPASALEPLGNAIALVGHLPVFKELKTLDGAFGHVDMNVLPEYAKP